MDVKAFSEYFSSSQIRIVIQYSRTSPCTDKNNFEKCVTENNEKPRKFKLKGLLLLLF